MEYQKLVAVKKLEDLLLRMPKDASGKEPSIITTAILQWWAGKHPTEVGEHATHFERMLAKLSQKIEKVRVKRSVERDTGEVEAVWLDARRVTVENRYRLTPGGPQHTHTAFLTVLENHVREVPTVLRAAANAFLRDLGRRFHSTGVTADLMIILAVEYDLSTAAPPGKSLERVASHFGIDAKAFEASWRILQHHKEVEIKRILAQGEGRNNAPRI